MKNIDLEWEFEQFATTMANPNATRNPASTYSQEAHLLWGLAGTCRVYGEAISIGPTTDAVESATTFRRLKVVEALLTGISLSANPLRPPSEYGTPQMQLLSVEGQLKQRELEFWWQLGEFVSTSRISPDPVSSMRNVLDSYENRDILYSIVMCVHIGDRRDENDIMTEGDRAAYFIGRGFIDSEKTRGSNHVFQLFCRIAAQKWED